MANFLHLGLEDQALNALNELPSVVHVQDEVSSGYAIHIACFYGLEKVPQCDMLSSVHITHHKLQSAKTFVPKEYVVFVFVYILLRLGVSLIHLYYCFIL